MRQNQSPSATHTTRLWKIGTYVAQKDRLLTGSIKRINRTRCKKNTRHNVAAHLAGSMPNLEVIVVGLGAAFGSLPKHDPAQ
jgi:hypothetical protein